MHDEVSSHIDLSKIEKSPTWLKRVNFKPPSLIVGCGVGTGINFNDEIYGIDLFIETCLTAKIAGRGRIICADAHKMPIRGCSFQQVLLMHSLEHVICPFHVLSECYRVLKNGGDIHIEVPNSPNRISERTSHIYGWNAITLQNILKKIGFINVQATYVDHLGVTDIYKFKNKKVNKLLDKLSTLLFPNSFRAVAGHGQKYDKNSY
jgi:ubiquinone/menaquinone biosynthesis C-methylase UbiE